MPTKNEPVTRQNMQSDDGVYFTHPAQRAKISMIATPIGNLSDLTPRALEALRDCDELWCEDTRHTQNLFHALKIDSRGKNGENKLRRFDQHTSEKELERMLERVREKCQWVGVVTDAGTPGVSDPGAKLVEKIYQYPEIRIEPIPGVSAVSALVSIAGFQENSFHFHGFFPREEKESIEVLSELTEGAHIFFESPKRIKDSVDVLLRWVETVDFIPEFCFAKELTKMHETVYRGKGLSFLNFFIGQQFDERGEWAFSVSLPNGCVKNKKTEADWEVTLECLIQAEIPTKSASQIIAEKYNIAKNLAYQKALELQKK